MRLNLIGEEHTLCEMKIRFWKEQFLSEIQTKLVQDSLFALCPRCTKDRCLVRARVCIWRRLGPRELRWFARTLSRRLQIWSSGKASPPDELQEMLHFIRGHVTLHLDESVGMSVGPSIHPSHFWIASGFCITAPAQPSTTVLPRIWSFVFISS